jgi:hypothetical protein
VQAVAVQAVGEEQEDRRAVGPLHNSCRSSST